jgi:hypothetical protein
MVTPMVNIEQAVGRIKRVTGIKPIVVDLVDTHKNFQNQWRKRRAFYKSEGCEIVTVKSGEYLAYSEPLRTPWKLVYAGKRLGSGAADCSKMGGTNEDADEDEDALLKTECLVEL